MLNHDKLGTEEWNNLVLFIFVHTAITDERGVGNGKW
jgi:hypothetical protein